MPDPFALTHATVVTGDREGTALPDHTVVVGRDGTIEAVGQSAETAVPTGYRTIEVTGRFVVPGLINAHAHLFADGKPIPAFLLNESIESILAWFGRSRAGQVLFRRRARAHVVTQLHSGVTTLRSVGDVGYEVVGVCEEIERGAYVGPRVFPSGPLLAVPGGHGAPQIALTGDSPSACRRNTRTNLEHGVKAIKVSATGGVTDARAVGHAGKQEMSEEMMAAVCEEAHGAGVLVAAHAQSSEGILAALRAGVDTIEHGASLTEEIIGLFHDNPRSLRGYSALIPTIQAALPLVKLDQSATGIDDIVRANAAMIYDRMMDGIRTARDHRITLGMGTDSGVTFATQYNTWRELDLLVRYGGLSPAEALNAATATNARILGLDAVTGSVEVGKSADLVVLSSDPLEDFRTFTHPEFVIARGHVIDHPQVERIERIDARFDEL